MILVVILWIVSRHNHVDGLMDNLTMVVAVVGYPLAADSD